MPNDFMQYLIIFLVMLLFARDYLGILFKKWFGVDVKNGNGNGKSGEYDNRLKEMDDKIKEIKDNHLHHINESITRLETKMDIVMEKLKL